MPVRPDLLKLCLDFALLCFAGIRLTATSAPQAQAWFTSVTAAAWRAESLMQTMKYALLSQKSVDVQSSKWARCLATACMSACLLQFSVYGMDHPRSASKDPGSLR